jgi:hypothetical protein
MLHLLPSQGAVFKDRGIVFLIEWCEAERNDPLSS